MKYSKLYVSMAVLLGLSIPLLSHAAELAIEPNPGAGPVHATVGSQFSVSVLLSNAKLQELDLVEAHVTYDPTIVRVVDNAQTPSVEGVAPNPSFLTDSFISLDASRGNLKISKVGGPGVFFKGPRVSVATITFQVAAAGQTQIGLTYTGPTNTGDSNVMDSRNLPNELLKGVTNGVFRFAVADVPTVVPPPPTIPAPPTVPVPPTIVTDPTVAPSNPTAIPTKVQTPGTTDRDKDGIADTSDNCPRVPNPKQEDSNKNKVGDACDTSRKQAACALDSGTSNVALRVNNRVFIVDPMNPTSSANSKDLSIPHDDRNASVVVADLPATLAKPLIGSKSVALVRPQDREKNALMWRNKDSNKQIPFGAQKDIAFACHADNDTIADPATINLQRMMTIRSQDGKLVQIKFGRIGRIRGVLCQDFDGDGIDEVVVHHLAPFAKGEATKGEAAVTMYRLLDGKLIKSASSGRYSRGIAAADVDGDGYSDLCTFVSRKSEKSEIACSLTRGGRKVIKYAGRISDIRAGLFSDDPRGKSVGRFVVLNRNRTKINVVSVTGSVVRSTDIGKLIGASDNEPSVARFARCR